MAFPVTIRTLAAWLLPALLATGAAAASLEQEIALDASLIRLSCSAGGESVRYPGAALLPDEAGFLLPASSVVVVLPPGMRAGEVRAVSLESRTLALAGAPERGTAGAPSPAVNQPGEPLALASLAAEGRLGGESIAVLQVRNVSYDASRGALQLHTRVALSVDLVPDASASGAAAPLRPLRQSAAVAEYRARLAGSLGGAQAPARADGVPAGGQLLGDFGYYQPGQYPSLDGSLVEYVIITSDELAAEFQRLADWKTKNGVPAVVRTISWIETRYPGRDRQERIRNFIADAYAQWGTLWVLLGGDESIIPSRIVYTGTYGGNEIAADLYYSDLDRTWDDDGDGVWGEGYLNPTLPGDNVDLYPDVLVGRAPVETVAETQAFINKTLTYIRTPSIGYQNDALFIGEVVFPTPWNPGDPIYLNGCEISHDAGAFVPATWDTNYLCEWPDGDENYYSVVAALNAGPALVTVVGHGDPFKWSTSDGLFFKVDDAKALSNTGKYFLIFYANCNTSQTESECINEYLLLDTNGGAIGAVAATRFDFPSVGRNYHEEFYRLLFQSRVHEQGALQALMKVPWVAQSRPDLSYDRWTQLTYGLLGDPQLALWTEVPQTASITAPATVNPEDSLVTVTVRGGPGLVPVPEALVTLWKSDTGEYARGLTDAGGEVNLAFWAGSLGAVFVTAAHPSYLTALDTLQIVAGEPRLMVESVAVDDDSLGASAGNGNGLLEAGETAELAVTVRNASGTAVDSVTAGAALAGGGALRAYVEVDGSSSPVLLYVGRSKSKPAALPVALDLSVDSLVAWGRPLYAPSGPDSVSPAGKGRAYLWQDASGWHLRAAGGKEVHQIDGYLAADAPLLLSSGWGLEPTDAWSVAGDSILFSLGLDATEFEDGLDFTLGDSIGIALLQGAADFGHVGVGGSATDTLLVAVDPAAAARRPIRFGLGFDAAGDRHWERGFRLDLAAPELVLQFFAVNDSAPGGDGDGLAEAGETVGLRPTVENRGTGEGTGVVATLRALAGATVLDSVVALGSIPPESLATAGAAFRLTLADSVADLELALVNVYGRSWAYALQAGSGTTPAAPTGIRSETGGSWAEILWTPVTATDLKGYLLYRATSPGGPYQKVNSQLASGGYYRDEGLLPETACFYRITSVDGSGNESQRSAAATVHVGPPYQAGFPVLAQNRMYSSPLPVDLDANGDLELVSASQGWKVFAWAHDGTSVPGWPKSVNQETISSPAVGNLDADPQRELVIGSNDRKVYAFNHNGTGLVNPSGVLGTTGNFVQSTPALGDLDLDGDLEIIVPSNDGWVYVWHGNGTGYLNPDGKFATFPGASHSCPALADVDGDGRLEIFIGTTFSALYAWNHDGTGFRLPDGQFKYMGGGDIWGAPALGDLDADGQKEVIAGSMNGSVYVFNMSAGNKTGWPKATGGSIHSSPALGDLDRNGKLEVVVGSDDAKLYAWRYTGVNMPGFPVTLPDSVLGSPVIGDISGDGYPDIVVGCRDRRVYAFQKDGTPVPGWPQRTYDYIWHSAPAITDLDHDGHVNVIQGSYDGYLYVWDLSAPYDPTTMDWPVFAHDRCRTGFAGWVDPDGATAVEGGETGFGALPAVTALGEVAPNPANPQAAVSFDLARPGRVRLGVFDVAGRLVESLVDAERAAGRYRLLWEGETRSGRPVASGVYFVRLEADGGSWTRKLVLVK